MKLQSFNFHPHPIQVDGRALHGVRVGDSDVTEISLLEGVLIVSRGTTVWFTHTSYGTGVPVAAGHAYDSAWQRALRPSADLPAEMAAQPAFGIEPALGGLPKQDKQQKQRSKKQ